MIDLRQVLTSRTPSLSQRALRGLLWLASWPYRAAVAAKNFSYDARLRKPFRSSLPVVSVGNLSVGGTGKSPTVAWIARWLRHHELRVAILSRGYGQLASGQNDEALELELQLPDVPHLQHWDRTASARLAAEELEMQVLLLDDGFQHRRLARDLEIVLIDASEPPAARRLLPGGLLREPLASLKRADIVIFTRIDQARSQEHVRLLRSVQRSAPQARLVEARHRPTHLLHYPDEQLPVSTLPGKRVLAFCAIGNPESFFSSLTAAGAEVVARRTWPDHHAYSAADVDALAAWGAAHDQVDMLVCTLKDWVKIQLRQIGETDLAALVVSLEMTSGQEALEAALAERIVHRVGDVGSER